MRRFTRLGIAAGIAGLILSLGGCSLTTAYVPEYDGSRPGYVYLYSSGGCWADDIWYPACRWVPGGAPGYYGYADGAWWRYPGIVWEYQIGRPPPLSWRHRDPYLPHHFHAPPTRRPWHGAPYHTGRHGID